MQKNNVAPPKYNPFWVCLLVFAALAIESGIRFNALWKQRKQLDEAQLSRPENIAQLSQLSARRQQIEPRLQALSLDLLQIAQTNNAARQIVQEFNIQWTPPASQPKP